MFPITDIANSLLNSEETKFYEVDLASPCVLRALSRDPSSDGVMPRAEVHVRAQASHGNVTVLSHLKQVV